MRFAKPEGTLMVKLLRNAVLVLFLVVFVSIVYNFRHQESDTVCALMAEATVSEEFRGVFVRDEKPVTYSGNGILSYNVADGGKLGSGSVIATVYKDEAQISRNREIEKLEREINLLRKIQNPGTFEQAQPAEVSASIEENYRNLMYCRDMNKLGSIADVQEALLVQMSTYQIITDEVQSFDQQIADISMRIDELKRQSVKAMDVIKSSAPAYFVSYCDGYEDKLASSMIDELTPEQIRSIGDERADDPRIVGKLVEGYDWYVVGIIDNTKKQYAAGEDVTLRFESCHDEVKATIRSVTDKGDASESVIIIACSNFNHNLVQHRVDNVELIKGRGIYRGLKIPREAIRFEDVIEKDESGAEISVTYKGVFVRNGEQIEFKKIDVIYEGSDYVLSEVHPEGSGYVVLYDDIMTE